MDPGKGKLEKKKKTHTSNRGPDTKEKKWALICALKLVYDAHLIELGSLFQSLGLATEKALCAFILRARE